MLRCRKMLSEAPIAWSISSGRRALCDGGWHVFSVKLSFPRAVGYKVACMIPSRFAMPLVVGRGAGLGNEMIVWAKAYIAAQQLNIRPMHPAWGLNTRNYRHLFGTSRFDWVQHRAMRAALPLVTFSEADYLRVGGGDFADAIARFAEEQQLARRTAYVLGLSGMWGGMDAIRTARTFLRGQLLSARHTTDNLFAIDQRFRKDVLRVAFHIRRGDFARPIENLGQYQGVFNVALPLSWYEAVADSIQRRFAGRVQFLIVSDANPDELAPLVGHFDCVTTGDIPRGDISDLLALADSDFMVCSISSYSVWAAMFSDARYAWFAPNLTPADGFGSIWGHEPLQAAPGSATYRALTEASALRMEQGTASPRGIAVGPDGLLAEEVFSYLENRIANKRRATDIVRYGVTPLTKGH